jgi:hypothetical protein
LTFQSVHHAAASCWAAHFRGSAYAPGPD